MEARITHGIEYKKGPRGLALKFINGDWITSTFSNDKIFKDSGRRKNTVPRLGYTKRVDGKTTIMTYLQAVEARDYINSVSKTKAAIARQYDSSYKSIDRVMELLEEKGSDGFVEYGVEA